MRRALSAASLVVALAALTAGTAASPAAVARPAASGCTDPVVHDRYAIHAVAGVQAVSGGGVTSGSLRLAMSTGAQWNALGQALLRVASGIQHDFTQDDQQLLRVQQQLQGFAQQLAGFDQALNGTDIVRDAATGQTFEAPYSAFSASGPAGPGYYAGCPGSLRKLVVETP